MVGIWGLEGKSKIAKLGVVYFNATCSLNPV